MAKHLISGLREIEKLSEREKERGGEKERKKERVLL